MTPTLALWRPGWYGLGQTIVAGGAGVFFLTHAVASQSRPENDHVRLQFWDDLVGDESSAFAVQATIQSIRHASLGEVRGLIVHSLDIVVVTREETFTMDAEQEPGWISRHGKYLTDLDFIVELSDVAELDEAKLAQLSSRTEDEIAADERAWAALLGLNALPAPYERDPRPRLK